MLDLNGLCELKDAIVGRWRQELTGLDLLDLELVPTDKATYISLFADGTAHWGV